MVFVEFTPLYTNRSKLSLNVLQIVSVMQNKDPQNKEALLPVAIYTTEAEDNSYSVTEDFNTVMLRIRSALGHD